MDNKLKFQSSGVSIKDADVFYGKNHVIKNQRRVLLPGAPNFEKFFKWNYLWDFVE